MARAASADATAAALAIRATPGNQEPTDSGARRVRPTAPAGRTKSGDDGAYVPVWSLNPSRCRQPFWAAGDAQLPRHVDPAVEQTAGGAIKGAAVGDPCAIGTSADIG